jgi:hypothetical protein
MKPSLKQRPLFPQALDGPASPTGPGATQSPAHEPEPPGDGLDRLYQSADLCGGGQDLRRSVLGQLRKQGWRGLGCQTIHGGIGI